MNIKLFKLRYPEPECAATWLLSMHQNGTALLICIWKQNTKRVSDIKVTQYVPTKNHIEKL